MGVTAVAAPRPGGGRWRRGPGSLYRRLLTVAYLVSRDAAAVARFLAVRGDCGRRSGVLRRFVTITNQVRGYHTLGEMVTVADAILRRHAPVVVECGVGPGGSTAKLAVATAAAGGRLIACDTFRGIPANDERHRHLDGRPVVFREGAFRGREATVRAVLDRWAEPVVELRRGRFEDTLPAMAERDLDVVVLDVDLLASTRCCLVHLFPRLAPGGILFTQDGHLEATVALLGDAAFWRDEVGVAPPAIAGLGRAKLLALLPVASETRLAWIAPSR